MALTDEYIKQQKWRKWSYYVDRLPIITGGQVWDIGCGIGTVSHLLADKGAQVLAIDNNSSMLEVIERKPRPNISTCLLDLKHDAPPGSDPVKGIWCGFSLAYFVDIESDLRRWTSNLTRLQKGSWIAVLEVDRLFSGHSPLPEDVRSELSRVELSLATNGAYDFRSGSKIFSVLESLGFEVYIIEHPVDPELHFDGPALAEIVEAWRLRFRRTRSLYKTLGSRFEKVEEHFLECLQNSDHCCNETLWFVVGRYR